jgi:hypothetical protein
MFDSAGVAKGAGLTVMPEIVIVVDPVFVTLTNCDVPCPTVSLPKLTLDELATSAPVVEEELEELLLLADELLLLEVEAAELAVLGVEPFGDV